MDVHANCIFFFIFFYLEKVVVYIYIYKKKGRLGEPKYKIFLALKFDSGIFSK